MAWIARQRGLEVVEFGEDTLGERWSFGIDEYGGGWIETVEATFDLTELLGAFVRLNPVPGLPGRMSDLPEDLRAAFTLERRYGLHRLLLTIPGKVINSPAAGRSNCSKPFQMRVLQDAGFKVPEWISTNEPGRVRDFSNACCHGAIFKACSGLRSRVRRVDELFLESLSGSPPVVVQEYIPGVDVRVHTLASGTTWATRIESVGLDYRFDEVSAGYSPTEAPENVRKLCLETARKEGLALAGFDFRVDERGTWWCLEANPVPTFLPYEAAAHHRIADSILEYCAAEVGLTLGARVEVVGFHNSHTSMVGVGKLNRLADPRDGR